MLHHSESDFTDSWVNKFDLKTMSAEALVQYINAIEEHAINNRHDVIKLDIFRQLIDKFPQHNHLLSEPFLDFVIRSAAFLYDVDLQPPLHCIMKNIVPRTLLEYRLQELEKAFIQTSANFFMQVNKPLTEPYYADLEWRWQCLCYPHNLLKQSLSDAPLTGFSLIDAIDLRVGLFNTALKREGAEIDLSHTLHVLLSSLRIQLKAKHRAAINNYLLIQGLFETDNEALQAKIIAFLEENLGVTKWAKTWTLVINDDMSTHRFTLCILQLLVENLTANKVIWAHLLNTPSRGGLRMNVIFEALSMQVIRYPQEDEAILQLLYQHNIKSEKMLPYLLKYLPCNSHVESLKLISSLNLTSKKIAAILIDAVDRNQWDLVRVLCCMTNENRPNIYAVSYALTHALKKSRWDDIAFISVQPYAFTEKLMQDILVAAAEKGQMALVEKLCEHNYQEQIFIKNAIKAALFASTMAREFKVVICLKKYIAEAELIELVQEVLIAVVKKGRYNSMTKLINIFYKTAPPPFIISSALSVLHEVDYVGNGFKIARFFIKKYSLNQQELDILLYDMVKFDNYLLTKTVCELKGNIQPSAASILLAGQCACEMRHYKIASFLSGHGAIQYQGAIYQDPRDLLTIESSLNFSS